MTIISKPIPPSDTAQLTSFFPGNDYGANSLYDIRGSKTQCAVVSNLNDVTSFGEVSVSFKGFNNESKFIPLVQPVVQTSDFGEAIIMSDDGLTVIVCAPLLGRVYVYESDDLMWTDITTSTVLTGIVDIIPKYQHMLKITSDGSSFIVANNTTLFYVTKVTGIWTVDQHSTTSLGIASFDEIAFSNSGEWIVAGTSTEIIVFKSDNLGSIARTPSAQYTISLPIDSKLIAISDDGCEIIASTQQLPPNYNLSAHLVSDPLDWNTPSSILTTDYPVESGLGEITSDRVELDDYQKLYTITTSPDNIRMPNNIINWSTPTKDYVDIPYNEALPPGTTWISPIGTSMSCTPYRKLAFIEDNTTLLMQLSDGTNHNLIYTMNLNILQYTTNK